MVGSRRRDARERDGRLVRHVGLVVLVIVRENAALEDRVGVFVVDRGLEIVEDLTVAQVL